MATGPQGHRYALLSCARVLCWHGYRCTPRLHSVQATVSSEEDDDAASATSADDSRADDSSADDSSQVWLWRGLSCA